MVHGLTNGVFFDDKQFWPIFERAQDLDVPLYMHPATPHEGVIEAYYKDYVQDFPSILTAGWGFTVETATQGIRIVLSGVLDEYPGLKIILGHLGESLPFSLWRIDQAMSREGNRASSFRDAFCEHFYITTSGNFFQPGTVVLRDGDGRRPHPVFRGLAVRLQHARGQVDGRRAALRRGPGKDPQR